jgi:hypothetical protein
MKGQLGSGGFYLRVRNAEPDEVAFKFGGMQSCGGCGNQMCEPPNGRGNTVVSDNLAHPVPSGMELPSQSAAQPANADNGD